jgi:hypothetical protein
MQVSDPEAKFRIYICNVSLTIAKKLEAKEILRTAATLLF